MTTLYPSQMRTAQEKMIDSDNFKMTTLIQSEREDETSKVWP